MPDEQVTITGDANVVGDYSTAIKAREVHIHPAVGEAAPEEPAFRVLTVVSRPLDQSALPEIGDAWSLADELARVQAPIELAFVRPPAVEALRRRMADDWDVVHFDGHGIWAWRCEMCEALVPSQEGKPDPTACPRCGEPLAEPAGGYLAFEQRDGLLDLLPAARMAELVCPPGGTARARLVILTACQSAMGSPSLASVLLDAGVPAVLGMRETVSVGAVVTLLPPFYANLGAGRTVREALDAALPALEPLGTSPLSGTPWVELPVLMGPGADAPLCQAGCRAGTRVERERLVGVPAPSPSGALHGDFVPDDPPGGRKGYLVRLAQALGRGERLVVLTGVGGIGKTALAAAAVRRVAWRYPGGVFWVDGRDYLETGLRLESVLGVFAHVYGEDFGKLAVARQRELALAYLRRIKAPALVVLDNADVADEGVWRFAESVPRPSAVLVTTRTEPEYGACLLDVVAMTPREGLTFLAAEIGRRRNEPGWVLGVDEPTAAKLIEIAKRLDGHALALLQAAGMAGGRMGLDHALAQVRANPARGETARRFDFSYNPLPEGRKELLHRLAAFAAGFDLQAALNLCTHPLGEEGFQPLEDWDAELPELVRGSFVERHEMGAGYERFRLHPVMREYVRGKAGAEPMAAHERRMARYFVRLADWSRDQLGNPETALAAVGGAAAERGNLLAAQEACLRLGMGDEAVSLAYDLNELFERSGHWADRRRVLEAGIEAAREGGDGDTAAQLSHNLGVAYHDIGEYGEARARYEQALEFKREAKDEAGVAKELHQLGVLAQDQGDYPEARRLYQEALDIEQQLGDRAGVAKTLHNLGVLAQDQGDYAKARRLYGEAADTFAELGARREQAAVLHQLGMLAQQQGDYPEARRLYQESLDIEQQLGNRAGVAYTLGNLGNLALGQGNLGEARRLYQQVRGVSEEMGDRSSVAKALHQLGNVAYLQEDYPEARRLYQESLDIKQQLGDRAGVALSQWGLGNIAQDQGDYEEAERQWSAALETFRELGDRKNEASVLPQLGMLAQDQGDYPEARRLYQEALDIKQQLGDRAGVAKTLHQLGTVAQIGGDYPEARRLYQESLDIEQQLGDRAGVAMTLAQLALLEEAEGSVGRALELIREAEAIFKELRSPYAAQARKVRERLEVERGE